MYAHIYNNYLIKKFILIKSINIGLFQTVFGVNSCNKGFTKIENGVANIVRENKQCLMEASYACSVYIYFILF